MQKLATLRQRTTKRLFSFADPCQSILDSVFNFWKDIQTVKNSCFIKHSYNVTTIFNIYYYNEGSLEEENRPRTNRD